MLPVKQESHLHYQGRSCKGKYFALQWERRALESSDLESNLGLGSLAPWLLGFLASWLLALGSWFLALGLGWGLWASGFGGGRARCLGGAREKQVPFDFALWRLRFSE
jgi:hypothetical protein